MLINDKFDLERSPDLDSFHMRPITELRPAAVQHSQAGWSDVRNCLPLLRNGKLFDEKPMRGIAEGIAG